MTSETIRTMESPEIQTSRNTSVFEVGLFLLGSYVIALLLSTAVHELGHGLALASIPINFRLVLNPFSSSMTVPLSSIPTDNFAFVLSAGTILELIVGTIVIALFWRWRRPEIVPILMVAPLSYLKSAGYFLVGIAIPDGDTALLITMGIPALVIQTLGVLMLVFGVLLLILMFPLLGISRDDSFRKIVMILFLGMALHGFGMIAFALILNPLELYIGVANVVSMMVTILILAAIFRRGSNFLEKIVHSDVSQLERSRVLSIAGLALIFIIAELIFFN